MFAILNTSEFAFFCSDQHLNYIPVACKKISRLLIMNKNIYINIKTHKEQIEIN